MLATAISIAGQVPEVLDWYTQAKISRASVAMQTGRNRLHHAEIVARLYKIHDPERADLTPPAREALACVYDVLQEEELAIRDEARDTNPYDLLRSTAAPTKPINEDTIVEQIQKTCRKAKRETAIAVAKAAAADDPSTRLQTIEDTEKARYVLLFLGIIERCVIEFQSRTPPDLPRLVKSAVAIADGDETEVRAILKRRVNSVTKGTMKIYVPRWLALEIWYGDWTDRKPSDTIYPLTERVWFRYLEYLDAKNCGPSVPVAIRSALAFFGKKIGFDCELVSDLCQDIIDRVMKVRGKPIKEAECPPRSAMENAEHLVNNERKPFWLRFAAGWALCHPWAAGRGDDVVHIWPATIEQHETFYGAIASKTKNNPNGCKITIPDAWLVRPWLREFFELYMESFQRL